MSLTGKGEYDLIPGSEHEQGSVSSNTALEEGTNESTVLGHHNVEPLEVDAYETEIVLSQDDDLVLCSLREPWLISVGITVLLAVPTLLKATLIAFSLTGRMWPAMLFSIHLTLALWTAWCLVPTVPPRAGTNKNRQLLVTLPSFLMDAVLFGSFYSTIGNVLIQYFLTEPDGTTVIEWSLLKRDIHIVKASGLIICVLRLVLLAIALGVVMYQRRVNSLQNMEQQWHCLQGRVFTTSFTRLEQWDASWSIAGKRRLRTVLRGILGVLLILSLGLVMWCTTSIFVHWGNWSAPSQQAENCDTLDTTECALPFPSFHHMVPDQSTETGWRVKLDGQILPPLKGGLRIDPTFLNELDGFSTMAPLLFYVNGLKEAQELGQGGVQLQGPSDIALSVTNRSATLLLDVEAQMLVPHSAEIDYLDADRPLVMVFPAKPLNHNTHYALAVVNAADVNGKPLPPTQGMTDLFLLSSSSSSDAIALERLGRYTDLLIPSLTQAAPWFSFEQDPSSLQLLFDFQTISASSQLGPVRAVRDATLKHVSAPEWGDWSNHVRVIRRIDGVCSRNNTLVARTIHAEMDVPWFLQDFGPGHRDAVLDSSAVQSGTPATIGTAKFVVHVPCSVRAAALNETNATALRAVMEFGHGLFFDRQEASDKFLLKMANDNGYLIMAMDWRGMSAFDLLIVIKTLMSTPRLFQAVRDNLIQGYANKMALQHFSQNGMLDMDWLHFGVRSDRNRPIPTFTEGTSPPASIFYGISQGGILGAGYTALSGPTGLIDRGILGVPGSPFALVLTRSSEFKEYDAILLLNFYCNRHVRILLSLVQIAWDTTEGSGVLAPPVTEPFPRMLLQAGLGDATVPTLAAEALSRGLGASILPGNPRQNIYGIPVGTAANGTSDGPHVTLTELMFEKEYESLPVRDVSDSRNGVHVCVRLDPTMIKQVEEFINTGQIIDFCKSDGCFRQRATCRG